MVKFAFRLRFHLLPDESFGNDVDIDLIGLPNGAKLKLKAINPDSPERFRNRSAVIGGPFESEAYARESAITTRTALLRWAVNSRLGIDLGNGYQRSHITEYGLKMFELQIGSRLRNDLHGIDVYEIEDNLKFGSFEPRPIIKRSAQNLVPHLKQEFSIPVPLSPKQELAAELYCASFFDQSFRSRFITLVTAIEALIELADRSTEAVELVRKFQEAINQSSMNQGDITSMIGSSKWLAKESIRQSGSRLCQALLGEREYDGLPAAKFFKHCYDIRSRILHTGDSNPAEMSSLTSTCLTFVGDLLQVSFGFELPS